eukprot:Rhum_TRINITY_DN2716_c0_g1::Rhum_TRINITY_DN2716_c0_g1_i1::g.8087::m.8087
MNALDAFRLQRFLCVETLAREAVLCEETRALRLMVLTISLKLSLLARETGAAEEPSQRPPLAKTDSSDVTAESWLSDDSVSYTSSSEDDARPLQKKSSLKTLGGSSARAGFGGSSSLVRVCKRVSFATVLDDANDAVSDACERRRQKVFSIRDAFRNTYDCSA